MHELAVSWLEFHFSQRDGSSREGNSSENLPLPCSCDAMLYFPFRFAILACAFSLPRRKEPPMNIALSDRRVSARHNFRLPLRVRILKSAIAEQRTESVNLSERGIYFPTNSPLRVGNAVQVLLKMPEEITGEPTNEWLCSGHVVRIESFDSPRGRLGVGVQFDCYEVSRRAERPSASRDSQPRRQTRQS